MNLIQLAENNYRKFGEYECLIFNARAYTNRELLRDSRKMASALIGLGVKPGDKIVVMLPNCPEVLISYQAILRAGGIIVPAVPLLTAKELNHILINSEAREVITCAQLLAQVTAAAKGANRLKHIIAVDQDASGGILNFRDLIHTAAGSAPTIPIQDNDVAVILYTSGTTGTPKGVMLTHKNLYTNAVNSAVTGNPKRSNIRLAALPLSHSFGFTTMNIMLIYGNLAILMPRFNVEETFRLIDKYRITHFPGVPAMFALMLQADKVLKEKYDLSCLEGVTSGSAPLPTEIYKAFQNEFGCTIREGYGLSEASPVVSMHYFDRKVKPGSVGQPIPETRVRIVDDEQRDLPPGEIGELIVSGPGVCAGYYRMPGETALTIHNGWLSTGDMAGVDKNGYLYIVERKKDLIIRGGFNVYPRDVEKALYRHPAVAEAAVIGIPDPVMGEEIKAFVVLQPGSSAGQQEIIDFCRQQLSKNKCPKQVTFLDSLPKSPIGKILRKQLRKHT